MAVKEGRGRFPGQTKYDQKVGGHQNLEDLNEDLIGILDETQVFNSPSFKRFDSPDGSDWVSVFGIETYDGPNAQDISLNESHNDVGNLWQSLFGDEVLNSPFQDGHYIYQVLPGYGVGSKAEAPTLFIADLENPSQIHNFKAMIYCSKNIQCNKELQLYNIYIHQQNDNRRDELNQIMPNYNDLSKS